MWRRRACSSAAASTREFGAAPAGVGRAPSLVDFELDFAGVIDAASGVEEIFVKGNPSIKLRFGQESKSKQIKKKSNSQSKRNQNQRRRARAPAPPLASVVGIAA